VDRLFGDGISTSQKRAFMQTHPSRTMDRGAHEDARDNKRKAEKRQLLRITDRPKRSEPTKKHVSKILACISDNTKKGALLDFTNFF